jgi:hypothetical protein
MVPPIAVITTHKEPVQPWPALSWDAPGAAVAQHFIDCSSGALGAKNKCVQKLSYGPKGAYGQRCGIDPLYK